MTSDIIVVSGLPRSGTSVMMQMLSAGGVAVLSDGARTADADNPRGYLELEQVKQLKRDASWLSAARGKAVKVITQLVYDLPASEQYRILLMERDLDEILASQEKMLARVGRATMPREKLKPAFESQIARFDEWIGRQSNITILRVPYAALIDDPIGQATRIGRFLDGTHDVQAMAAAVDPTLYRNRAAT